jgi:hypothetical protein
MENKINQNIAGLNLDSVNYQIKENMITYALNANVQSHDGNSTTYTNEPSNQICYDFTTQYPGYKIVGTLHIVEQSKLVVFLAHPNGKSLIGEITNLTKDCTTLTESETDCGCASGTVVTSTVGSEIGVSADTCCTFTPLIVDNCCVNNVGCYRFAVRNNGQYQDINYVDCNGDPKTVGILANGYYGFDGRSANYTSDIELLSKTLISEDPVCDSEYCCLKLSVDFPVFAEYRIDNCETRVYFVARNIPPRYFSIEEPLGRDQCGDPINQLTDACGRLKLFPDFCQPEVYPTSVDSGGRLKGGVYSFSVAYADENGKELTDYIDFCNPIPIFERAITEQTEYETSKSIRVSVNHKTAIFDYFNLTVAENINEVTTYHLVGTYRVNQSSLTDSLVYTGDYSSTFSSIVPLIRSPHYEHAEIIEKQNDILMLADLVETPKYNFQPIANQIQLRWETVQMPVDKKFDYSNPEVAYFFRTYQRDEVYPFGIKFKLKNGKYTDVFHIPGRLKNDNDKAKESPDNKDVFSVEDDCIKTGEFQRWQVYNTGSKGLMYSENPPNKQEEQYSCAIIPGEAGQFAYWESTETYPCYEEVWGDLAGQPIRHHKFPDSAITHIHKNAEAIIYPIGVRVQETIFENIVNNTTVYDPLNTYGNHQIPVSELICGYELVRGNRVNNKSVIAKGLVYDVGTFHDEDTGKNYYYPNYPYNDRGPDAFIKTDSKFYDKGDRGEFDFPTHTGFVNSVLYGTERFTFHSPDTHFQYPKIGTELKLETLEYGIVKGHFVPVLDHPKYKIIGKGTNNLSVAIGAVLSYVVDGEAQVGTTSSLKTRYETKIVDLLNNTTLIKELIEKALPYKELAWQYNSVGNYTKYESIPNTGDKRRVLEIGLYANDKIVELNDDFPLHNRLRETSVYLKTNEPLANNFPLIRDTTRFTISQAGLEDNPSKIVESNTRAYYSSIKRNFPNQYGPIENIKYVSTGYSADVSVDDSGYLKVERTFYPAFGGDTYINQFALKRKHSFFTRNLANLPAKVDNVPFDYWLYPNLGYPTYYAGNSSESITAGDIAGTILAFGTGVGLTALALSPTPPPPPFPPLPPPFSTQLLSVAATTAFATSLASILNDYVAKVNLDDSNIENSLLRNGYFYTASYGIPVFYVESDINVDLRHGRNDLEENFYPNVGDGIPDEWLHEVNVPIKFDNFYHYNATYSAQNLSPNLPYRLKYPSLECLSIHHNRVIYSDPANSSNYLSDAWRVFRPGNFYDFPKQGGRLVDLNAGENERVYARFENTTKVYNSRITLSTTSPYQLEIGNAEMFKQKPVDLAKSDLGYIGTQHKAYVKCEYGTFWVDAKRGHIYQITGDGFNEIKTENNYNWFKQNLPFQILKDIPNADIDNPAIGLGIVMGWDERYERVFITKLDYRVKPQYREGSSSVIKYITDTSDSNYRKYVLESGNTQVTITFGDPTYFENKSWTVAYSPKLKNFISFYSFLPNFFVPLLGHFQTLINTSTGASTWNHNLSIYTYQTYYNRLYPYILEYNVNSFPQVSTVNSVTLMQDIQEYYSDYEYYSLSTANKKNLANFTKAIIYNKEQSSGIIKLIPEEFGNTRQKITYPRMTATGIEALISRREHLYTFNGFWNVAAQGNGQPLWSTQWSDLVSQYPIDKVPNTKSVRPVSVSYQKSKIKSDFAKLRLIQDQYSRFKFINTIQITQTNP